MAYPLFLAYAFALLGRPQDLLLFLQPLRLTLVLMTLTAAAILFGKERGEFAAALKLSESRRMLAFYALMIVGIPFAVHKGLAFDGVFKSYLGNVIFFFCLVSQITTLQRLKTFAWMVCICTLLYSVVGGLLQGIAYEGRFGVSGGAFDPNDTAYVLLSLFPISLFFVVSNEGLLRKIAGVAATGSAIAVVLQTGSRGGLLGACAAVLILLLTKTGGIRFSQKLFFVAILVGVLIAVHDKLDIERYMTLTTISSDYNVEEEGGRIELWNSAIDLAIANPITGVGVECYPFAHLRSRQLAGEDFLRWQYTHNSFLQIASETGLVGFALFLWINVSSMWTFLRVSRFGNDSTQRERRQLGVLAGLMLVGFTGLLVSGFFLSQGYSIFTTLYFGLAAVVGRLNAETVAVEVPRAATGKRERLSRTDR